MKTLIGTIISTNKGWFIRQGLKYIAMGATALTTWLVSHGYEATSAEALSAGLVAGAAGGLELLFSKLASKIAAQ